MTAAVLSEIERLKQNEQIAKWTQNENALLKQLQESAPALPINNGSSETDLALQRDFVKWCSNKAVRHCPARPWVVASFILEHRHRGESHVLDSLAAIGRLHDRHNLANPTATASVRAVLETMIDDKPPRSWTKHEKELFAFLPAEIRAAVGRREQQRETYIRHTQNELDKLRKQYAENKDKSASNAREPDRATAG